MIRVRTVLAVALAIAIVAIPPVLAQFSTFGDIAIANAAPAGPELAGQQDGSTELWNSDNDNRRWSGGNRNDNRNWHRNDNDHSGGQWHPGWVAPVRREPARFAPFRWLPWVPWHRDR